jgi:hypothetical protein
MNNTQLLSVTENLCISRIKDTLIMKQEQVTWYSNDGTLNSRGRGRQNCLLPVKQENPPCFIFVDSFTINTLQLHKYIKDYLI